MATLRGLSLRQLRALAATVRGGSVSAAAQALYVTAPAVSTQIKLLEKLVDAPLLRRTPEGIEPTEIGRELLTAADEIEVLLERTMSRVTALRSGAEGIVALGVVSTGKYFAPRIVAAFQRSHPGVRVKLSIGNRGEIIKGLERREYDLLIMGRPPEHVPVVREILGDHPHILVAAPDHRLVGDSDVLPEDLLSETILAREEGSGTRILADNFLSRISGGRPYTVVEMGTNETIKQAVMAGLGIALISAHTCYFELQEGKLAQLRVAGLPLVRQWYLIHRADSPPTNAARVLAAFILDNKSRLLPVL